MGHSLLKRPVLFLNGSSGGEAEKGEFFWTKLCSISVCNLVYTYYASIKKY